MNSERSISIISSIASKFKALFKGNVRKKISLKENPSGMLLRSPQIRKVKVAESVSPPPKNATISSESLLKKQMKAAALKKGPVLDPTKKLPYFISRTPLGKQLPVYTEFKEGRTKVLTLIRKIDGNIDALRSDLLQSNMIQGLRESDIYLRKDLKQLWVKGAFMHQVKGFLNAKGF